MRWAGCSGKGWSTQAFFPDRLLDGEISGKDFTEMSEKVDREMALLKNTLSGLQTEMTPYRNYVKHTLPMLENIVEYYRKADGKTKKRILGCIFAEKFVLEKGRVASTPFTIPVQVLLNTVKDFQGSKKNRRSMLTSCPPGLPDLDSNQGPTD